MDEPIGGARVVIDVAFDFTAASRILSPEQLTALMVGVAKVASVAAGKSLPHREGQ